MLSVGRIKTITEVSNHHAALINELEQAVFPWAAQKKMHKKVLSEMKPYLSNWEGLPPENHEALEAVVITQTIMGRIFSQPERISSVKRVLREELRREVLRYLQRTLDHPWYMSGFYVQDKEGPHLLRIFDYHDEEEYLLYSQAAEDIWTKGKNNLYTLLFFNGECLQTYGGIFYLDWATREDFLYFARRHEKYAFEQGGLRAAMTPHPVEWAALYSWAEVPQVVHRGEMMECCRSVVRAAQFSTDQLPEKAQVDEANGNIRVLLYPEDPMFGPRVIWERRKKRLHLSAMTEKGYELGRELLRDIAEFPEEPDEIFSSMMAAAADQILGPDEFSLLDSSFREDTERDPNTQIDLNRMNDLIERLNAAHNTGRRVSSEELAAQTGLSEEMVIQMRDQIEKIMEERSPVREGFLGFSPEHMYDLMHNTIDNIPDVVEIRSDRIEPEDVEESLWVALALALLRMVEEEGGTLKATDRGNLPRRVVDYLFQKELNLRETAGEWIAQALRETVKVRGEQDAHTVHIVRTLLQITGFLEEVPGAFTLTEKSQPLPFGPQLKNMYLDLLISASQEYLLKYPGNLPVWPLLKQALPFILYALSREPEGRFTARRLAEIIHKAFPKMEEYYAEGDEYFPYLEYLELLASYNVIRDFALPLGLVRYLDEKRESRVLQLTPLFRKLFQWKDPLVEQ